MKRESGTRRIAIIPALVGQTSPRRAQYSVHHFEMNLLAQAIAVVGESLVLNQIRALLRSDRRFNLLDD
jgi:hypothetical protein